MLDNQNLDLIVGRALEDANLENKEMLENTPFSIWIVDGDQYTPAVSIRKVNKLPSGVFKVCYQDDNYRVNKIQLNTDEIYTFTKSFTDKILNEIDSFWKKADLYKQNNLIHKRGILLVGAPGVGKTSLITLLINQLKEKDGIVFLVNNYKDFIVLTDCLNPIIRKIEPNRPIITVIEDIDKLIEENGDNDSELLNFLDGKNSIDHHIVIMTSNNTNELSGALLRPSRVDMHFEIPVPDDDIRKEYFEKKGINSTDINAFVKATNAMSFAQLKEVFIGTQILEKPLEQVVSRLINPLSSKDYLTPTKTLGY